MSKGIDRELDDLPQELRWWEWMRRVEAVLFASSEPVPERNLASVVGKDCAVNLLIEDLNASLVDRPVEIVRVGDGWLFRTRPAYGEVIRQAAILRNQGLALNDFEGAVLAAIAYHQPITRKGLAEIFGREINRDLLGRLRLRNLIGPGPRSPRPGAPQSFVTTQEFLAAFDLKTLRDLPDREAMQDAGLAQEGE